MCRIHTTLHIYIYILSLYLYTFIFLYTTTFFYIDEGKNHPKKIENINEYSDDSHSHLYCFTLLLASKFHLPCTCFNPFVWERFASSSHVPIQN